MEIETALRGIGFALSRHAETEDHAERNQTGRDPEECGVHSLRCGKHGKDCYNYKIADQGAHLVYRCLCAECRAAFTILRIAQGDRTLHAELHMFTQRIQTDRKRDQHLRGRQNRMHTHTDDHDDRTDFIDALRRKHIKRR